MSYPIYIFFGLAPSVIWLLFFLRKDAHPESNRMILRIFFWGMLVALPVIFIEIGISERLLKLNLPPIFIFILYWFIGIALVEESFKYLVVRDKVLKHSEFDEPVDAMLYMIIAALGFSALENILVLLPGESPPLFLETITTSSFRFVGATFLHALCSGTLGYFLALSFLKTKKRLRLLALGLGIATILHSLFNISIIGIETSFVVQNDELVIVNFPLFISSIIFLIIILVGLAFFVSFGFKKLKKLSSVCKINKPET